MFHHLIVSTNFYSFSIISNQLVVNSILALSTFPLHLAQITSGHIDLDLERRLFRNTNYRTHTIPSPPLNISKRRNNGFRKINFPHLNASTSAACSTGYDSRPSGTPERANLEDDYDKESVNGNADKDNRMRAMMECNGKETVFSFVVLLHRSE